MTGLAATAVSATSTMLSWDASSVPGGGFVTGYAIFVDGEQVAEIGPGAIVGERAVLEGGRRTATLTASTPCRVAVATSEQLDHDALRELSLGHRREEIPAQPDAQER